MAISGVVGEVQEMANDEEQRRPLLNKNVKYYADCPGCKLEKLNEARKGYPIKEFVYVGLLVLCNSLPISSLFPFLYFMVNDFHVAKRQQDIGFYAGYIGSAFMFGRFLTAVLWGMAADKYGRKPVMLSGAITVVVFNSLFGLSSNFWMAVSMRFLLGSLNGVFGPIKAYAAEVCREEHQALGLSIVSTVNYFVGTTWGVGLIIGPAIGGLLAQPADKYPHIFSKDSLFGRFPYFLPCLCISIFAFVASVAAFQLPETLHKHPANGEEEGSNVCDFKAHDVEEKDLELDSKVKWIEENKESVRKSQTMHPKSLLRNWPLMSSIIIYCTFSLHDIAYSEIFSLWAVSPKEYGGLNFTSSDVGEILAISGFGLLIFPIFVFPPLANWLGAILVTRLGAVLSILVLAFYPLIALLSGFHLWLVINCASLLKNMLSMTTITGLFLLLNNSVSQDQRGAANGLAMTGQSLFKALGPIGGGSLFAWSQRRQHESFLPGDQMVFFILNVILAVVVIMTFEPFLPRSINEYQSGDQTNSMATREAPSEETE